MDDGNNSPDVDSVQLSGVAALSRPGAADGKDQPAGSSLLLTPFVVKHRIWRREIDILPRETRAAHARSIASQGVPKYKCRL